MQIVLMYIFKFIALTLLFSYMDTVRMYGAHQPPVIKGCLSSPFLTVFRLVIREHFWD